MLALSIRCSCYMGILCIGIFTRFGNTLGISLFHNQQAGAFITTLCWLCPFMYLATTLGSIQNGLGKTSSTFFQNVAAMILRHSLLWNPGISMGASGKRTGSGSYVLLKP